jgi:murein L,D-transpeptidase YafK
MLHGGRKKVWINKIRYTASLQLKRLQFQWETWRQGREIAQAYGEKKFFTRRTFITIALIIMLSLGASGVVYTSIRHGDQIVFVIKKIRQGINFSFMQRWVDRGHEALVALKKLPGIAAQKTKAPVTMETDSSTKKKAFLPAAPVSDSVASVKAVASVPAPSPLPTKPVTQDTAGESKIAIGLTEKFSITMNYCILANKADRKLYLLGKNSGEESWKTIGQFSVLVGRNDGQKMTAGDQRTPEGIYFIVGRKESEELNAIYGPLAYMLNYPNEEDRKAGRTGQGIWIHGTREDTTREATRGCVVLNNNDMISLSRFLRLGIGTPVVIVNTAGLAAPEQSLNFKQLRVLRERILNEYNTRRAEFEGLLSQWKQAWESRDIESYSRFYDHDRFFGEGMKWEAWREKKQRTFQNYSTITIGLEKINVSEFSETTAVILFIQRYESNVLQVQRPKKLSFYKSDGRWKIFKEETYSRQELLL